MYQHGKRTKQPRNMAVFFATLIVVGLLVVAGWFLVIKDIGKTTAPQTNVPIVTNISEEESHEYVTINETDFSLQLPSDWKLQERRLSLPDSNAYIWVSTKKGANDRRLTLYIDAMPADYKLVRMQPLIANGAEVLLGNLSDNCINFVPGSQNGQQGMGPVEAKWENVTFMCDPIIGNQTIGTGSAGKGIKTTLTTSRGPRNYFFFYEDHNVYPDSNIFRKVLQSFRAQ